MRYLPLTDDNRKAMLRTIGAGSIDELFEDVPAEARLDGPVELPNHRSEIEVERAIAAFGARNLTPATTPCFIGGGAYHHHIPAAVDHLIQRSEFLTSYTPYQPEISQGTLQALFEFQTEVALITSMEVANASMYDGATACGEAVLMAHRLTRRQKSVLSGGLHPHYRDVTRTLLKFSNFDCIEAAPDPRDAENMADRIDAETACVVVQNPSFFGHLRDFTKLAEACHAAGALLVVVVNEVVSLGAVKPPGDMGADIVAAEGQSLGVPLGFGGPHVGLFATRERFVRQMPGRLCGETLDQDGRRGYVLTLAAREQHIRRERATSNICTNSGLCALAFCIHTSLLGEEGFQGLARLNHANAVQLADRLAAIDGVEVVNRHFFNEFTLALEQPAAPVVERLAAAGVLGGLPVSRLLPEASLANLLVVAATETVSADDIEDFAAKLVEALK